MVISYYILIPAINNNPPHGADYCLSLRFLVLCPNTAPATVFLKIDLALHQLLVLAGMVVDPLACVTLELDKVLGKF